MSLVLNLYSGIAIVKAAKNQEGRSEINFNRNWAFMKGEIQRAETVDFDASQWQSVRLPHDWAISGPFDPSGDGSTGKLPWQGVGWYRKIFKLDTASHGKRVCFNFDGVMAFPRIYINGRLAGQWDYGYTPFWIDATDYVKFGEENVIAVSVDTRQHRSRWYPGAGIYRDVTMVITDKVHLEPWGTFVTTPLVSNEIATVKVRNTIINDLDSDKVVDVTVTLADPEGKEFVTKKAFLPVPAGSHKDVMMSFPVHRPLLWDVASPNLYRAKTTVELDGEVVDAEATTFGIRSFEFTPDDGFHLNGRRVQIYGVCLHHDLGPLGTAFNRRAMERELEIMREMGVNAVRTSHNPPARGLVELCDRMGLLVIDEVFDKWDGTADRVDGQPPLEEHGRKHIRSLVMRDRNSPSVIMWSIGNEIGNDSRNRPGSGKSPEHVTFLSDFVRDYDSTRPVTLACHTPGTADSPILDSLDVVGYNYGRRYDHFREKYPQVPLYYSESASTVSTRGYYSFPLPDNKLDYDRQARKVSSYDLTATSWSDIPDFEFHTTFNEHTFLAGEFVWTGFDYLGEPTPVRQSRSSYFGIVDLCGIPKDRYYLYRSLWRPEETTVHILPHWNWPDRVGKNVPVFVYTNGDSAELFLNEKSLGKRTKKKELTGQEYYELTDLYRLRWNDVIYAPGQLQVVAYKDGAQIGQATMQTAGEPAKIRLTPDRNRIKADGCDLSYILVEMVDEQGNLCPLADNLIKFSIDGPAQIVGVGNGDQNSLEPFQTDYRNLFYGKAMLIVRSREDQLGQAKIMALSEGVSSAQATVQCQ
ncbi:MAG: glycoside hydrolase family 2 protein [Sedimentisphaerales bacterium]|nr:glycoside hydrolase family 2 protein [Sedimentisphaerales bacterium]